MTPEALHGAAHELNWRLAPNKCTGISARARGRASSSAQHANSCERGDLLWGDVEVYSVPRGVKEASCLWRVGSGEGGGGYGGVTSSYTRLSPRETDVSCIYQGVGGG